MKVTLYKYIDYIIILVILDVNDRDLSCVVSSLVQILGDPHYRTITGFESLVQKEWVAMGHPFTARNGFITTDDEDGPVCTHVHVSILTYIIICTLHMVSGGKLN